MGIRKRQRSRKRNARNANQRGSVRKQVDMTQLLVLWNRFGACVEDAIALSHRMRSDESLRHDYDLKWALAKHVENAQETVKAIDDKSGKQLFEVLFEIPEETKGSALTWRGLIAMRQVLAHKFWDIDHEIVWNTVTDDFPSVRQVVNATTIMEHTVDINSGRKLEILVSAKDIRSLNPSRAGETSSPGESLIWVLQDVTQGLGAMYLGRSDENKLMVGVSPAWMAGKTWNLKADELPPDQEIDAQTFALRISDHVQTRDRSMQRPTRTSSSPSSDGRSGTSTSASGR